MKICVTLNFVAAQFVMETWQDWIGLDRIGSDWIDWNGLNRIGCFSGSFYVLTKLSACLASYLILLLMLDEYKINRGVNRLPQISYIIPENSIAFRLDLQNYNVFTEISFTFLNRVFYTSSNINIILLTILFFLIRDRRVRNGMWW